MMLNGRIRVLQLIDSLALGGAERVVTLLATNINRERFEIVPCILKSSGPLEAELKAAGVPCRVLGFQRRSILTGPLFAVDVLRILTALKEILRDLSIDIIHTHLLDSTLIGIIAARSLGTPAICVTIHSTIFSLPRARLSLRRSLMRFAIGKAFSRADRIIAVSDAVARAIRLAINIPQERIATIPNGVDPNRFHIVGDQRELRQRLGLPINRSVIVAIGRLTHEKGYAYLLGALTLIPSEQRPLTLILGDGPDRNKLELRSVQMRLDQDVQFLGNRYDVPLWLAVADLFVLSSLREGLPLALLEAMAAGVPAVITAVGGNIEVVEDGVSAVLVPAGNEQALAKALSSLLNDCILRERMGRAARERFDRYFSAQRFVEAHERLYEEILTGHPVL
jgi:glycosyltransferase involved in cell wall biosynthesis